MRIGTLTLVAALSLIVAACASGGTFDDPTVSSTLGDADLTASTTHAAGDAPAASALPDGPSALQDANHVSFPDPLVDTRQIISGGPPPDGIPPIDDPVFLAVEENLELLPANEPVVSLLIDGDARAYPIRAMVWHEIVNDTVGGVPVAVTYCPLCNSAATYVRTIDGTETTFGTSGRLYASALVMYDRATESLWTHYNGTAVVGVLTGTELEEIASPLLSWEEFRQAYPTGQVLDWTQTGYSRDYGRNPYTGYDDAENTPFLFRGALDDRARAMQRVVGIEVEGESSAFALAAVSGGEGKATSATLGGEPLVILWQAGQASALDTNELASGYDVGSTAVFGAVVDGQVLEFAFVGGHFVDAQTETVWSITGEGLEGPLAGVQLAAVPHLDTFWFAWSTYQPDTALVEG